MWLNNFFYYKRTHAHTRGREIHSNRECFVSKINSARLSWALKGLEIRFYLKLPSTVQLTGFTHSLLLLSSFTWLSAQVHSNMVMHFSGRITDSFDREFRCLYADSQIIDCFFNSEEEGMPYYPSYQAMMTPGMGMGLGPVMGLDLLADRYFFKVHHLLNIISC